MLGNRISGARGTSGGPQGDRGGLGKLAGEPWGILRDTWRRPQRQNAGFHIKKKPTKLNFVQLRKQKKNNHRNQTPNAKQQLLEAWWRGWQEATGYYTAPAESADPLGSLGV